MTPLILYHANCTDGFGAAWAAFQKFGANASYIPVQYGTSTKSVEEQWGEFYAHLYGAPLDRDIYILDFSLPPDVLSLLQLHQQRQSVGLNYPTKVVMLDHHESAMRQWTTEDTRKLSKLGSGTEIQFDMDRSGAGMAWDYFLYSARPMLVNYIEDRDLWKFKLPYTKAFCAGLQMVKQEFEEWDKIVSSHSETIKVIDSGEAILKFQQGQIDKSSSDSSLKSITLCGVKGLACNCNNNVSEVGSAIARKSGTFSLTFFIKDQEVICSLRSIAPFNVANIAKTFGGGGHAQAAGFKMPIVRFFTEIWI